MEKLKELIEIVNPTKLKNVNILGKGDSLIDELYHRIRQGDVDTDQDALRHIYGNSNSKTALYQLKRNLYNKLLESIFIIDLNEKNHSSFEIVVSENFKNTAAFEWLSRRGGQKNILPLGEKILKTAIRYNQSDIIVRVAKVLTRKIAIIKGDEVKLDYYNSLFVKYQEIEQLNVLAEYYWYKVSVKFQKKDVLIDKSLAKEAEDYAIEIEQKLMPNHRALTFAYLTLLKIRKCEIEHDFEGVINFVNGALSQLANYPDAGMGVINGLLSKKLSALITLRRYSEANKTAAENLSYLREGSKPWFTLLQSILVLHLHENKYSDAYRVYLIAVNHKAFGFLTESRKDTYKLYRAYFQFFINIGLLDFPDKKLEKKPFRYARFCNELQVFTKDKKGINIAIIVAQFLLLFTEQKYKEAHERIRSVKSFSRKHLREDETFRSNCFLKMLVKLVECDFHKAATLRKTKDLFEKLKMHPTKINRLRSDVEIIPYEDIWSIILERIDNSFRGGLKKQKLERASAS